MLNNFVFKEFQVATQRLKKNLNLKLNRAIIHIHRTFKFNSSYKLQMSFCAWNESCEVRNFLQLPCWKFFTFPLEILRKIQSNSLTLSPSSLYSLPWFLNRAEQGIIAPAARAPARRLPQLTAPSLRPLPGHEYPPPLTFPPVPSSLPCCWPSAPSSTCKDHRGVRP